MSTNTKPVPDDFRVFARCGEVTGQKREQLFRLFDSTIDDVLEKLEEDEE